MEDNWAIDFLIKKTYILWSSNPTLNNLSNKYTPLVRQNVCTRIDYAVLLPVARDRNNLTVHYPELVKWIVHGILCGY